MMVSAVRYAELLGRKLLDNPWAVGVDAKGLWSGVFEMIQRGNADREEMSRLFAATNMIAVYVADVIRLFVCKAYAYDLDMAEAVQLDEWRVISKLTTHQTRSRQGSATLSVTLKTTWPIRTLLSGNVLPHGGVCVPYLWQSSNAPSSTTFAPWCAINCIDVSTMKLDEQTGLSMEMESVVAKSNTAKEVYAMQILALRLIVQSKMGMFVGALIFHNPLGSKFLTQGHVVVLPPLDVQLHTPGTGIVLTSAWNALWTAKGWKERFVFDESTKRMQMCVTNGRAGSTIIMHEDQALAAVYEHVRNCILDRIRVMCGNVEEDKDRLAVELAVHIADYAPWRTDSSTSTMRVLAEHSVLNHLPTELLYQQHTSSVLDPLLLYAGTVESYKHQWKELMEKNKHPGQACRDFLFAMSALGCTALTRPHDTGTEVAMSLHECKDTSVNLGAGAMPTDMIYNSRLWRTIEERTPNDGSCVRTLVTFTNVHALETSIQLNPHRTHLRPGTEWKPIVPHRADTNLSFVRSVLGDAMPALVPSKFADNKVVWCSRIKEMFDAHKATIVAVLGQEYSGATRERGARSSTYGGTSRTGQVYRSLDGAAGSGQV